MAGSGSNVVVAAFSEDHAERLTGILKTTLRYWDRTGFFHPEFASENRRLAYSRIYSFKDIASLRVLNALRTQFSVPLQHLRKVRKDLSHLSDAKWTATELFVLNKKVVFVELGTKQYREIVSKQYVIGIPLRAAVSGTEEAIKHLQLRDEDKIGNIERARYVSHNAWVIAGTRISVKTIKRFAEDGYSVEQIMDEYPKLTEADINAAIGHRDDDVAA